MFRGVSLRAAHRVLLLAVAAALFVPNLGAPSLWDIDEGNNSEAAREMLESGNWVVPTFNFELRVDKPVLLYWLQMAAYSWFGVGEWAARLPSALAALATVWLTYELGRCFFDAGTALLAGLILASTVLFCGSAHFANPDALLNAFTVLTFLFFWRSFSRGGRGWFVPVGISTGLAVLAKGPVGVLLPVTVIGLFVLANRRWRMLLDRRQVLGVVAFALVALPWYILVATETKAGFLRGFLLTHNVGRFLNPMEHHSGPIYYYVIALLGGFAPWSVFLGLAGWYSVAEWKREPEPTPSSSTASPFALSHSFLWCWIAVYGLFFSLAGTKLPNYILPLYPPVALLTARFLERWRCGAINPPAWAVRLSLVFLALVGIGTATGLLLVSGVLPAPFLGGRSLPGLEVWAAVGTSLVVGAALAGWSARHQYRGGVVLSVATAAVFFIGTMAAGASLAVDQHKAPRTLAHALGEAPAQREIRVACYHYFQPSLVFYCRREVFRLATEEEVREFLASPLPAYLFVPAPVWDSLEASVTAPHRVLGRQHDFYRSCEVLVVANW